MMYILLLIRMVGIIVLSYFACQLNNFKYKSDLYSENIGTPIHMYIN